MFFLSCVSFSLSPHWITSESPKTTIVGATSWIRAKKRICCWSLGSEERRDQNIPVFDRRQWISVLLLPQIMGNQNGKGPPGSSEQVERMKKVSGASDFSDVDDRVEESVTSRTDWRAGEHWAKVSFRLEKLECCSSWSSLEMGQQQEMFSIEIYGFWWSCGMSKNYQYYTVVILSVSTKQKIKEMPCPKDIRVSGLENKAYLFYILRSPAAVYLFAWNSSVVMFS